MIAAEPHASIRDAEARRRVVWPIGGHGLLRVAGGTSGVLIGLYVAELRNQGADIGAATAGTLGAISFGAELFASVPLGFAADAMHPRRVMTFGAIASAAGALLLAVSHSTALFSLSKALEGIGAAAIVPAILAYLADATEGRAALRARVMSFFELTLLAGLAFGGVIAAQLFHALHARAFFIVAGAYVGCAAILGFGVSGKTVRRLTNPLSDVKRVLHIAGLRQLAPVWLCVNAAVGVWLGPTLVFLLTQRTTGEQYLAGMYATNAAGVGWLYLGYAVVFGAGVAGWSAILPRVPLRRAMLLSVSAMLPACGAILVLNHSAAASPALRWSAGVALALFVMIESGFTPAALAWLAQTLPMQSGRGTAMGVYSVLLGVGAAAGSLLAAFFAARYAIDGLLYATALIALAALAFVRRAPARKGVANGATS